MCLQLLLQELFAAHQEAVEAGVKAWAPAKHAKGVASIDLITDESQGTCIALLGSTRVSVAQKLDVVCS